MFRFWWFLPLWVPVLGPIPLLSCPKVPTKSVCPPTPCFTQWHDSGQVRNGQVRERAIADIGFIFVFFWHPAVTHLLEIIPLCPSKELIPLSVSVHVQVEWSFTDTLPLRIDVELSPGQRDCSLLLATMIGQRWVCDPTGDNKVRGTFEGLVGETTYI